MGHLEATASVYRVPMKMPETLPEALEMPSLSTGGLVHGKARDHVVTAERQTCCPTSNRQNPTNGAACPHQLGLQSSVLTKESVKKDFHCGTCSRLAGKLAAFC